MDLNQVSLSPELLSSLYGKVLVEDSQKSKVETPIIASATAHGGSIRSLGLHNRSILILVNETRAAFLTDKDMGFLTRILNACKLTMGDVALVNMFNCKGTGYQQLQESFPSQIVIGFGITPQDIELPVDFPPYQTQNLSGCIYLCAPSLNQLEVEEPELRKLWVVMKKLFNI